MNRKSKKFLMIICLLFPVLASGQGFPVKDLNRGFSVQEMISSGRGRLTFWRATNWATTQPAVTAGAANSLGSVIVNRAGRKIILTRVSAQLSGPGQVEGVLDIDAANTWQTWVGVPGGTSLYGETRIYFSFGPNGGDVDRSYSGFMMQENSVMNFQYRSINTTGLNCTIDVEGIEIPNEPHPDAAYKIGVIGDSNANFGNLGNDSQGRSYLGSSQWSEVFRDSLRASGVDAQIFFNDAEDGKTMMEGSYRMLTGYTRTPVNLLFVMFGTNDMVSTKYPTEQRFKEAMKYIISEQKRFNPSIKIVFLLPIPTNDTDRTDSSRDVNIRSWINYIATNPTEGGGVVNNVYLVNPGIAVTMGDADYKEQSPTPWVHLNGSGSTKAGRYIWSQLKKPIFNK